MANEIIIYCDESISNGAFYSNFYGGALVRSTHIDKVRSILVETKKQLNMFGEVKWDKVTANYLTKYITLMDQFFDLIEEDIVKIRNMFTQNAREATHLTDQQNDETFFILYYQFLKHAFGLIYSTPDGSGLRIRLLLDQLPDNRESA